MFSYIDIDIYHETVPTPFHTAFWLLQSLYCWRPFLDSLTQYSNPLPPAPSALKSQMSCHLPNLIFRPGPPYHSPISAFLLCWRGLYFLSLVFFFFDNLSDCGDMESQSRFNLHFPYDEGCWTLFQFPFYSLTNFHICLQKLSRHFWVSINLLYAPPSAPQIFIGHFYLFLWQLAHLRLEDLG